jgi:hypothetical protein
MKKGKGINVKDVLISLGTIEMRRNHENYTQWTAFQLKQDEIDPDNPQHFNVYKQYKKRMMDHLVTRVGYKQAIQTIAHRMSITSIHQYWFLACDLMGRMQNWKNQDQWLTQHWMDGTFWNYLDNVIIDKLRKNTATE